MKSFIKKVILYNKIYPIIQKSTIYEIRKKSNGLLANYLSGNPSKDFFVIGVTGTNGKTTTVNLIHKLLNDTVAKTVMISTANIKIGNEIIPNERKMTSLDVFDMQSILASAKQEGCKIAVLEVSSHGLEQSRFEGIQFDVAVLTNITHEHLDYHKNMENYAQSKKKLFGYVLKNKKSNTFAVFPHDDEYGRQRAEHMSFDKKMTFGIYRKADLKAEKINETSTGTQFYFSYLGKEYLFQTPLLGTYNVQNILAAMSIGVQMGINIETIIEVLQDFKGVPGRMENIHFNGINFFVDFAHTPDALEKTLTFLSNIKKEGRLIVVFGAPGNRDRSKRPKMGEMTNKFADIIIATDDDPDTENRLSILQELIKKINRPIGNNFFVIPEREFAIKLATQIAQPGDIVLIAGKGNEAKQYTNFRKKRRSDKEEVLKNIEELKQQGIVNHTI